MVGYCISGLWQRFLPIVLKIGTRGLQTMGNLILTVLRWQDYDRVLHFGITVAFFTNSAENRCSSEKYFQLFFFAGDGAGNYSLSNITSLCVLCKKNQPNRSTIATVVGCWVFFWGYFLDIFPKKIFKAHFISLLLYLLLQLLQCFLLLYARTRTKFVPTVEKILNSGKIFLRKKLGEYLLPTVLFQDEQTWDERSFPGRTYMG